MLTISPQHATDHTTKRKKKLSRNRREQQFEKEVKRGKVELQNGNGNHCLLTKKKKTGTENVQVNSVLSTYISLEVYNLNGNEKICIARKLYLIQIQKKK